MCKLDLKTEITTELVAKMVRRHFGWDRIPTPEEADEFLFAVKEKMFEVTPCAQMDTELISAVRDEAATRRGETQPLSEGCSLRHLSQGK